MKGRTCSFAAEDVLLIECYISVYFAVFGIVKMELNDTSSYQRCFVCSRVCVNDFHIAW